MSLSEEELALVFRKETASLMWFTLSPLGHAVVAEQLADALQQMK